MSIELTPPLDAYSFPSATARVVLDDLGLEPAARVVLEAYFRSSSMRFQCGIVGEIFVPARMVLTEIDRGGAIQFRLLVIAPDNSGRIVASAEGIKPVQRTDTPDREPLLPVRETDLGEELWRVDVDDRNGPWLVINNRIPGLASRLRSEPLIQGLILPHALREVLRNLPSEGEEEGDHDWGDNWRRFLEQIDVPVEADDPSDDEVRSAWVEDAVERFSVLRRFAEVLRNEGILSETRDA